LNQQLSFFIGTSNTLFIKNNKILNCDIIVDVSEEKIEFIDKTLNSKNWVLSLFLLLLLSLLQIAKLLPFKSERSYRVWMEQSFAIRCITIIIKCPKSFTLLTPLPHALFFEIIHIHTTRNSFFFNFSIWEKIFFGASQMEWALSSLLKDNSYTVVWCKNVKGVNKANCLEHFIIWNRIEK
jgi:hypothetical protein